MSSAQEYGLQETRVGVYGKVTGVRDGRPIGIQTIDLFHTQLAPDEATRALSSALGSLGIRVAVPPPDLLEDGMPRPRANF
jgi:hypothetical protein